MSKIIMWVIVIVIVVGGIWYVVAQTSPAPAPSDTTTATIPTPTEQGGMTSGTADADLEQDLRSVDAQVQAASDAGISAQTFSDTQVSQTE